MGFVKQTVVFLGVGFGVAVLCLEAQALSGFPAMWVVASSSLVLAANLREVSAPCRGETPPTEGGQHFGPLACEETWHVLQVKALGLSFARCTRLPLLPYEAALCQPSLLEPQNQQALLPATLQVQTGTCDPETTDLLDLSEKFCLAVA